MAEGQEKVVVQFPRLEGWYTFPEAAKLLGITRQGMEKRAKKGDFTTAHTIGQIHVVSVEEIDALVTGSNDRTAELLAV
jgi:hypothetical protein